MSTSRYMIGVPALSSREVQVVELIVNEYSTKEIADLLFLSSETIKSHRSKIMFKLDVKNVAGIVREAIVQNLVPINMNYRIA